MDFYEIMDFAGFDLDKANALAKKIIEKRELENTLAHLEATASPAPVHQIVITII